MAKLSARGRTEVARLTQTITGPADSMLYGNLAERRVKTTLCLMSDRNILRKVDVTILSEDNPDISIKGTWKLKSKLKSGVTFEHYVDTMLLRGWVSANNQPINLTSQGR